MKKTTESDTTTKEPCVSECPSFHGLGGHGHHSVGTRWFECVRCNGRGYVEVKDQTE